MSRHSNDLGLTSSEETVLHHREEHGWFVNMIAAHDANPAFAYSFGLFEEFRHPEIIIFGLEPSIMHILINDVGGRIRTGAGYRNGDIVSDLLETYPCSFRKVDPSHYKATFSWACLFYGNSNFPALQLFWPDRQSRFPWESGFDGALCTSQPDLSAPRPSALESVP